MMGGFGEYNVVRSEYAVKLPESLSMADGALVEPLASASHGARMAGIRAGARVAVLGAGPIGLGAIFWATRLGAGRIVAVARTERQASLAHEMGATHFLCQGPNLSDSVATALGGSPEVVLECAGVPGLMSQAVGLAGARAKVVMMGQCGIADSVIPAVAGMKAVTISFSAAYSRVDFEFAVDALDKRAIELRALITATIGLDDLPEMFERLRTAPQGCKILVDPSGRT
jgi:(R,R)-butanediol dehydrogenase/meso-butanediol dehydrogenase/diacetyl reductase